jgi:hypothetical protein
MGMLAILVLAVVVTACSNDEADGEHCGGVGASCATTTVGGTASSTPTAPPSATGSTAAVVSSTTSADTASLPPRTSIAGHSIVDVETVRSIKLVATGPPVKVCSDAVTAAEAHNGISGPWPGVVLKDETVRSATPTRWLFCYGGGGSGEGVEALWSTNSRDWRFMQLGFGRVFHAGDAPAAVVFDDMRAAVSYDTMIGEGHNYAYTRDGGQTWTRMNLPAYPTPAP